MNAIVIQMTTGEISETEQKTSLQKFDLIYRLAEARWAISEHNLEFANQKYREILAYDPENKEAKDFFNHYKDGKLTGIRVKSREEDELEDAKRRLLIEETTALAKASLSCR